MGCAPSQLPLGNGLPPSHSQLGSNSLNEEAGSAEGDSITDFMDKVKTAEPVPDEAIKFNRKPRSNSIVDFLSRQKRNVSEWSVNSGKSKRRDTFGREVTFPTDSKSAVQKYANSINVTKTTSIAKNGDGGGLLHIRDNPERVRKLSSVTPKFTPIQELALGSTSSSEVPENPPS